MAERLDAEDKRKIHAEINQLVNQRFLLSTAAVTVFGVIGAWSIPRDPLLLNGRIGAFALAASVLLLFVLFALFILSHLLANVLRTYSSYLRLVGKSQWEKDWKNYRTGGYSAYTKAITSLFLVLGVVATAFPFGLGLVYSLQYEPQAGIWLTAVVGLLYVVFVSGIGFLRWFDQENAIDQRWQGVLLNSTSEDSNASSAERR